MAGNVCFGWKADLIGLSEQAKRCEAKAFPGGWDANQGNQEIDIAVPPGMKERNVCEPDCKEDGQEPRSKPAHKAYLSTRAPAATSATGGERTLALLCGSQTAGYERRQADDGCKLHDRYVDKQGSQESNRRGQVVAQCDRGKGT
ncbi:MULTISPECIES: hypothetical protein [Sphingomonas]|uniref:hypothetical protein n=1 Tax=Sphingomonas TaxID=13687 RepID=UPI001269C891|nr:MULTISPECIES: hypothetical protein [Sphingomonas]